MGTFFGGPNNKDYNILGSPYLGKPPYENRLKYIPYTSRDPFGSSLTAKRLPRLGGARCDV